MPRIDSALARSRGGFGWLLQDRCQPRLGSLPPGTWCQHPAWGDPAQSPPGAGIATKPPPDTPSPQVLPPQGAAHRIPQARSPHQRIGPRSGPGISRPQISSKSHQCLPVAAALTAAVQRAGSSPVRKGGRDLGSPAAWHPAALGTGSSSSCPATQRGGTDIPHKGHPQAAGTRASSSSTPTRSLPQIPGENPPLAAHGLHTLYPRPPRSRDLQVPTESVLLFKDNIQLPAHGHIVLGSFLPQRGAPGGTSGQEKNLFPCPAPSHAEPPPSPRRRDAPLRGDASSGSSTSILISSC